MKLLRFFLTVAALAFGTALSLSSIYAEPPLVGTLTESSEHDSYLDSYIIRLAEHSPAAPSLNQLQISARAQALGMRLIRTRRDLALINRQNAQISSSTNIRTLSGADLCAELIASGLAVACLKNEKLSLQSLPNDPLASQQWALKQSSGLDIDALGAWQVQPSAAGSYVGVIDTGIDYNHPDLSSAIWSNDLEVPNNGIDDDSNGYIDDIHGVNTANESGDPMDDHGHGTHVAGIIAAEGNNSLGVVGIAPGAKIIAAKFLDATGNGSLFDVLEAIDYLISLKVERGINIVAINNSWGGASPSKFLSDAIMRANQAGILFVVAAGNNANNNDTNPNYPAAFKLPNLISVAALDRFGNLALFSNYGEQSTQIAAPGSQILSTLLNSSYGALSGTSMAAPYVAGALALLQSKEPGLNQVQLKARVLASGVSLPGLHGSVANASLLNAKRLITGEVNPITYGSEVAIEGGFKAIKSDSKFKISHKLNYVKSSKANTSATLTISGVAKKLGLLRVIIKGQSCNLAPFQLNSKGKIHARLTLPKLSALKKVTLQAINIAGAVEASKGVSISISAKAPKSNKAQINSWCSKTVKAIRIW